MAPDTTERAALEEDGGPDARTIMQGVPFNIYD